MPCGSGDTKAHTRIILSRSVKDQVKQGTKSETAFPYSHSQIQALEMALSPERFQPYLNRAGGSRHKAILIYERNTALSESLYGVTQATEIALRNALHRVLSAAYGTMWFDVVELGVPQANKIAAAESEIRRTRRILTPGAVVAELGLGFWTAPRVACGNALWR
uniref:Uncharacterized protein n=1 Tax=Solibacter usitatus (strain Ellin6076) TaxID=234267 RepID=Q024T1_SOLUE